MKIIIENRHFSFDTGCRILKLKYEECPFDYLKEFWDDIVPYTFAEIAETFHNIEDRRLAIKCLGVERLYKEVNPTLVSQETINKTTCWANSKGDIETVNYNDTYCLYKVEGSFWSKNTQTSSWRASGFPDVYFVKCKDTSTDREYFIWVDADSVKAVNDGDADTSSGFLRSDDHKINAISAIAWTIQTNIKKGGIEKIVRQGDCILIKKKENAEHGLVRHLTEKEYRRLLTLES